VDEQPPIDVSLIGDELRLVMYNRDDISLFRGDTTQLTDWGEFMIMNIAWLLTQYELQVTIESYLNSDYRVKKATYGPFELTADRSNKVRRSLEHYAKAGVDVKRVVGFGDSRPLKEGETAGKTNDRTVISLSVKEQMSADDFKKTRELKKELEDNQKSVDILEGF
jgi:flagellar motor protein MotB